MQPGQDVSGSTAEQLLEQSRPHVPRRLDRRETQVELVAATSLLAVAGVLPLVAPGQRTASVVVVLALLVAHALASRIRLYLGAGYAMPTQLVLVPMLFLVPAALVPALVAGGLVGAAAVDVLRGRGHAERLVTGAGDAWHAVGACLVVLVAGEPAPSLGAAPVLLLALAAQSVLDLLVATLREWLGRGIPPVLQLRIIAQVYLIDLLLTPIGLLAATATAEHPLAWVAALPLLGLLAVFAADRRRRIEEAVQRADVLRDERAHLDRAIRRVGEAFATRLDRAAVVELALRTLADALGADRGRALLPDGQVDLGGPRGGDDDRLEQVLVAVADAARRSGTLQAVARDEHVGLSRPLESEDGTDGGRGVLAVARRGRPFSEDERALFRHLTHQAATALDSVELHDRFRRQATIDELTGLPNHRRFQEVLAQELERARRLGRPLALAMLDIDDFKAVNDTHGHQRGDAVLRAVAQAVSGAGRAADEPARYGGEEMAVVLPGTDLRGGHQAAESIRRAVEAVEVPLPGGRVLGVTVSVGVAALAPGCEDAGSLIELADGALYEAKRSGKNRTVCARHPSEDAAAVPAGPPHTRR